MEAGWRLDGGWVEAGGAADAEADADADADGRTDDALRLCAAATAHVAWQVHASLHLGHPELRRKGSSAIYTHTHTHTHTHTLIHNNNRTGARQLEPTGTAEKLAFCRDVTFCSSTQHTASREERGDTGWDRKTAAGLEGSGNDRPRLWVQCSAVLGGTDRCQTQTVSGNVLRVLWRAPRRAPCF